MIKHPIPADVFDSSYQACPADATVRQCLKGFKPTSIIHSSCVGITIKHTVMQKLSEEEFEECFTDLEQRYGVFISSRVPYTQPGGRPPEVLGEAFIEICSPMLGIAFAQDIRRSIIPDRSFDGEALLTATRNLLQGKGLARIPGGPAPPKVNEFREGLRRVPEREVQALKAAIAGRTSWKLDTNYNVLVFPWDEEEQLNNLIKRLARNAGETQCQFVCTESVPLPQPMYVYAKAGTVEEVGLCQPCMKALITEMVASFFNPATRFIDQAKLTALNQRLPPLPACDSELDAATSEAWPSVPLGAMMWLLCSSRREVAPVAKAWMTGTCEVCARTNAHLITACPKHPAVSLRMPPAMKELKCPHCKLVLCATCRKWHKKKKECDVDPPGAKRCPFCQLPVIKRGGCNHITCRCGKHWCYVCRKACSNAAETYTHLRSEHGGIY